jgi:putative ABC transport system permease protein
MNGAWYLGWRYLAFHKLKSVILIASITLMLFLPAETRVLVSDSAATLTARADRTPLLLGAAGSPLELVLNSLYFQTGQLSAITGSTLAGLQETQLGKFIPLNTRFHSRDNPIVGTTLDYFSFRGLKLAEGRLMGMLGECVLGAGAAAKQGVASGDYVVSSPETVFDIAGVYPLKMKVAGVLEPTRSADDDAVFVDIRTSWVIQGLGHGHQDLARPEAAAGVLGRKEGVITANASVAQYAEITAENVADFHFHGDTGDFPLTSIIAVPPDEKSTTLLRGRYLSNEEGLQLVVPSTVLNDLLGTVFMVQNYVVLGLAMLGLTTVAVIVLVFMLSQQLRRDEFHTLSRIGASRSYIGLLVASELAFVFVGSLLLSTLLIFVMKQYALQILQSFLTL